MISLEWAQNARDGNAAEMFFKVLLLVSQGCHYSKGKFELQINFLLHAGREASQFFLISVGPALEAPP